MTNGAPMTHLYLVLLIMSHKLTAAGDWMVLQGHYIKR